MREINGKDFGLARKIARQYAASYPQSVEAEFESEALLALTKAAASYDASKATWITHLWVRIHWQLRQYIRSQYRYWQNSVEIEKAEATRFSWPAFEPKLQEAFMQLSDTERQALVDQLIGKISPTGCRSTASRQRKRAIKKLQAFMGVQSE